MTDARTVSPDVLRLVLDGRWPEAREQARVHLRTPEFRPVYGLDMETHRTRVLAQAKSLADNGHATLGFPRRYGGQGDVGGSVTSFEMLAFADLSLQVKAGVQWGLFGGAILHLGTERHHEAYLEQVTSLELPGCFAMTETGHGSNVQSVETTATYDPDEIGRAHV